MVVAEEDVVASAVPHQALVVQRKLEPVLAAHEQSS